MEPARAAPVGAHDHRPSASEYERRRPEGTVLHQVVSEHWGAFVEHAEEQGRALPSFVQREVEAYLRCGMLEHGLLRLGCPACGLERLVPSAPSIWLSSGCSSIRSFIVYRSTEPDGLALGDSVLSSHVARRGRPRLMELVQLSCNHCGADIEVEQDSRFVTCRYCDAKLEVRRTDGAAFTRIREAVERIEKSTEALEDEVRELHADNKVLHLQEDLEELDRAWERRADGLMLKGDGARTVPTRGHAYMVFACALAFPMFALFMAGDAGEAGGLMLSLFSACGVAFAILGYFRYKKAVAYEQALAKHEDSRHKIEKRLAEAKEGAPARSSAAAD